MWVSALMTVLMTVRRYPEVSRGRRWLVLRDQVARIGPGDRVQLFAGLPPKLSVQSVSELRGHRLDLSGAVERTALTPQLQELTMAMTLGMAMALARRALVELLRRRLRRCPVQATVWAAQDPDGARVAGASHPLLDVVVPLKGL
jgi:hypothetical protein